MIRTPVVLLVGTVSAALFVGAAGAQRAAPLGKGIKPGETIEGEFTAKFRGTAAIQRDAKGRKIGRPEMNASVYQASIPVTLKAGEPLSVFASVTGDDRSVGIHVLDPTGKRLLSAEERKSPVLPGAERTVLLEKSAEYSIDEVSASGKYTIVVISDRVGLFTVRVGGDADPEDRESLERRLKELKKQVEEVEAKLKALSDKKR